MASNNNSLRGQIKSPKTEVFRRLFVKRRLANTGLFETSWQDITEDVKSWGSIIMKADVTRRSKFKMSSLTIRVANDGGLYNPSDDVNSFWYNYADQQRTLVKIEAGYVHSTLSAGGIYTRTEHPRTDGAYWDQDYWDEGYWDTNGSAQIVYTGLIAGDILMSSKNEVHLPIKPLMQVFVDYPAIKLDGFTTGGMTAETFMTMVRDHTDGSGNLVFRPFFGDTTANWSIASTTINYGNLNTNGAKDVRDKSVWQVMEKISEAENKIVFVTRDGKFIFQPADLVTITGLEFHGLHSFDTSWGNTIKTIDRYGKAITKYYSRVQIKHLDDDTSTSYAVQEVALQVSGTNNPWNLGHRTFAMENLWIPNSTTANSIASVIFNEVSNLKNEIEFTATFTPQVELLGSIFITYDSGDIAIDTLWDQNDWDTELRFAKDLGDAFIFQRKQFKVTQIRHNLNRFETSLIAREQ